jgi:hypothetical protein
LLFDVPVEFVDHDMTATKFAVFSSPKNGRKAMYSA